MCFFGKCSRGLLLLAGLIPVWGGDRVPTLRGIETGPLFFPDPGCGESAWGVWSPQAHGCFRPGWVSIESLRSRMSIQFSGASEAALPVGLEPAEVRFSSIKGQDSAAWTSMQAYSQVSYPELYPGIDLIYSAVGARLKSEFHISPGSDPSPIHLRYSGIPELDSSGNLVVRSGRGAFREGAPVAYQEIAGERTPVPVAFSLQADGAVGFQVGAYDPRYRLVIDPVLTFSTVFGGYGSTTINSIAVDSGGNVYFAGCTDATVSPILNALQSRNNGSNEAFVGKVAPNGKLIYATYLGGSGGDCATGIAVDSSGSAIVAGWTTSRNFPVTASFQGSLAGGRDAFVARLGPLGDRLLFSTYFGGAANDTANGVALDASGNIYIAGQTYSSNLPLRNALQPRLAGGADGFLAEFTPAGSLVYSTFYGGSFDDSANGIAVTPDGAASIAGATQSLDLPLSGAIQSRSGGGQDAFVAQFGKQGASLRYATYLGGKGGTVGAPEYATAIALDTSGSAYVTGLTSSVDFPTAKAIYSKPRGGIDSFVAKLSPSGNQLVYSTYLGGTSIDLANAITVDSSGNAYVAGATWSPDFPSTGQLVPRSTDYDAFITELDAAGATLQLSIFLARDRRPTRRIASSSISAATSTWAAAAFRWTSRASARSDLPPEAPRECWQPFSAAPGWPLSRSRPRRGRATGSSSSSLRATLLAPPTCCGPMSSFRLRARLHPATSSMSRGMAFICSTMRQRTFSGLCRAPIHRSRTASAACTPPHRPWRTPATPRH